MQKCEGSRLFDLTMSTDETSSKMSQAIRRLDKEQHSILAVMQVLGRVERIRELFSILHDAKDLPRACETVHELEQFSPICMDAYRKRYPEAGSSNQIGAAKERLLSEILKGMDEVLGADSLSPTHLQSSFRLLVLIGHAKEGVVRYSSFLNGQAQLSIDLLLTSIDEKKDLPYAGQISRLFEYASKTLVWTFQTIIIGDEIASAENRQIVYFSFLQIISEATERFIDLFMERRLSDSKQTLYQLDISVAELILITRHLEEIIGEIELLPFVSSPSDRLEACQELRRLHDQLMAKYPVIELAYVNRGVLKAIELDQILEEDRLGSCVDDTFFLCKKSAMRALGTGHEPMFNRVMQGILETLRGSFAEALERSTRTGVHPTDALGRRRAFAVSCNNITAASLFVGKFLDEIIGEYYAMEAIEHHTVLVDELVEKFNSVQQHFSSVAEAALITFYRGLVKQKYYALLSSTLTSDNDQSLKYAAGHATLMGEAEDWLTEESTLPFGLILAAELSSYWTKLIMRSKYTQLTAFQLDKQIRSVSTFFIDRYGLALKSSFTGLFAIAAVLMVDSKAEARELLAEDPELDHRLLSLRTDLL